MSENFMEQSVPFAEEAEAGIISAMFKDREVIQDIVQLVRDTDFYKPENAILFKAILEIDESGQSRRSRHHDQQAAQGKSAGKSRRRVLSWADRRCTFDGVQRQAVRKDRSGKIDDAPAHSHF